MSPVDIVAASIVGVALLRGLWNGLIREVFSLGALAGAVVVVRGATAPASGWLRETWDPALADSTLQIATGGLIGLGVILAVAFTGRLVRRGARYAGLGWADRLGGGLLGGAEGVLVVAVALVVAIAVGGRDQPLLEGSQTLDAFEHLETLARGDRDLGRVGSPPPGF